MKGKQMNQNKKMERAQIALSKKLIDMDRSYSIFL